MTRAYSGEVERAPNDLALLDVDALLRDLRERHPGLTWTPRIRFGGLLDLPDEQGETRAQAPVAGLAVDLRRTASPEREILNIDGALVRGRLPSAPGEILVSEDLFERLGMRRNESATFIGSTMHGSMTTANFRVVGTLRFGVAAMDRGALLADIRDIRSALDMEDAAGEVLGFFPDGIYREETSARIAAEFNSSHGAAGDEFSPVMGDLRSQSGLATTLDLAGYVSMALIGIFVVVMSIVLWNAGLMSALRRYGEMGVRLAMGESSAHIYRTLITESLMIGIAGSLIGTLIGVAVSWYLQVRGLDISPLLKNASMMIFNVLRARVTPTSFLIGLVPGLLATFLGTSISGLGIFRRRTSELLKEMDA
jgi:putative ABC transport system permease protein